MAENPAELIARMKAQKAERVAQEKKEAAAAEQAADLENKGNIPEGAFAENELRNKVAELKGQISIAEQAASQAKEAITDLDSALAEGGWDPEEIQAFNDTKAEEQKKIDELAAFQAELARVETEIEALNTLGENEKNPADTAETETQSPTGMDTEILKRQTQIDAFEQEWERLAAADRAAADKFAEDNDGTYSNLIKERDDIIADHRKKIEEAFKVEERLFEALSGVNNSKRHEKPTTEESKAVLGAMQTILLERKKIPPYYQQRDIMDSELLKYIFKDGETAQEVAKVFIKEYIQDIGGKEERYLATEKLQDRERDKKWLPYRKLEDSLSNDLYTVFNFARSLPHGEELPVLQAAAEQAINLMQQCRSLLERGTLEARSNLHFDKGSASNLGTVLNSLTKYLIKAGGDPSTLVVEAESLINAYDTAADEPSPRNSVFVREIGFARESLANRAV